MDKNNNNFGNTRKGFEETANVNIEKEVSELIKKGADKASINDLRHKFGDDKVFDVIQEAYFEKLASIRKRSIKFTKLIERKYGMYGYPLHIILNKALKYKKRYNLTEEEFELFRQYYQKSLNMRNNSNKYNVLVPNTNMAKVFGDDPYTTDKIHTNDGDHRIIKDIITLYDLNRANWQQVTLQSITYDYFTLALIHTNNQVNIPIQLLDKTTNYSSFIHPVIAAMYLPKINKFDEYFLFTNLAYILRSKYLGEPISTYHSYLMLYNLVTDPTDVVCNADTPLKDILNRVLLQVNLWKNVLRLRQGGFYDTYNSFVAADLMANIDNCKLSTYDAPDLLMIGDENVIIRRLLSSLAFRCATIYSVPTTIPLFNPQNQNPNLQVSTLNIPINYTQVSKVPMIYIRLPVVGLPPLPNQNNNQIVISNALSTVQPIMYNGKLESRMMSVVGTDGILIVSIPRRTYKPMSTNIYNLPAVFNYANMPSHAFGLEVLNKTVVGTNLLLNIGATNNIQTLYINSAVVLKEKNNNFIYGSKTMIYDHYTLTHTVYDPIYENSTHRPLRNFVAPGAPGANILDHKDDMLTRQTILIYTNHTLGVNNNGNMGGGGTKDEEDKKLTENYEKLKLQAKENPYVGILGKSLDDIKNINVYHHFDNYEHFNKSIDNHVTLTHTSPAANGERHSNLDRYNSLPGSAAAAAAATSEALPHSDSGAHRILTAAAADPNPGSTTGAAADPAAAPAAAAAAAASPAAVPVVDSAAAAAASPAAVPVVDSAAAAPAGQAGGSHEHKKLLKQLKKLKQKYAELFE